MKLKSIMQICTFILACMSIEGKAEQLGAGGYTDNLSGREDIATGKPLHDIEGTPKVSNKLTAPFPTTDWWSSLIWSFQDRNQFSENMHPHPLTLKTQQSGLDVGAPNQARIYSHEWQGTVLQRNSGYQFEHQNDFTIGLSGLNATKTVADGYNDWTVTALWEDNTNKLRATFGHGLPFVYLTKEGNQDVVINFNEHKKNYHFAPFNAQTYVLENINGNYIGGNTNFLTLLNAGNTPAIAAKVRVSYDFNGDGEFDKVELYANFATDASSSSWEHYDHNSRNGINLDHSYGEFQDMLNGQIKFEIWKTEGTGGLSFESSQSHLKVPFSNIGSNNGYLFFNNTSNQLSTSSQAYQEVALSGSNESHHPLDIAKIWYNEGNTIAVTINNTNYAFFAPEGSNWQLKQEESGSWTHGLLSNLSGKDYFSMVVLPNNQVEILNQYKKHAFAFITDTKISYIYDQEKSEVITKFQATTELKELGSFYQNSTLLGLYRHQWLHSTSPLTNYSYPSSRGEIKIHDGNQFTIVTPFYGILPMLPITFDNTDVLRAQLIKDINELKSRPDFFKSNDTYWRGKEYARIADLAQIADQLEESEILNYLINALKEDISSWLIDSGQSDSHFYYYNNKWGSLIGYPASFGSETQLNDHHFHYGYLIKAAATIARYDPQWASQASYGKMINIIIKDVANINRDDSKFPWLRQYDPYAGHAWASGHGSFASGNNQESSSESMNFSTAVILWGEATNQTTLRDLGIFLYSMENQAINQYWFDVDNKVYPEDFGHKTAAIVWGDGGVYGTWWTANPEEIHGINFLPFHGGSLYLGQYPDYVSQNLEDLKNSNNFFEQATGTISEGQEAQWNNWKGLILQYMALENGDGALAKYNAQIDFAPEAGTSHTQIRHWIENLAQLGHVVSSIRANISTYAVFTKNNFYHYIAYNPTVSEKVVIFTDGTSFTVPSNSYAIKSGEEINIQASDNSSSTSNSATDDSLDNSDSTNDNNNNETPSENVVNENTNEDQVIITPENQQSVSQTSSVSFSDPASRFNGILTIQEDGINIIVNTDQSRQYVILHYTNTDGIPQNVTMDSDGQGNWSWLDKKFDLAKPFHFTIQDSKIGQFQSNDYLYSQLGGQLSENETNTNNTTNTEVSEVSTESNNITNSETEGFILNDELNRFDGQVTIDNDMVSILINSDVVRNYVILHYFDKQGRKQSIQMIKDGEHKWIWTTANFDLLQPIEFTMQDPIVVQFNSEKYNLANIAQSNTAESNTSTNNTTNNSQNTDENSTIHDSENRYSLNLSNISGNKIISLDTSVSRGYVILHYINEQGIPQNVNMVPDNFGNWTWQTSDFDISKGFNFTIQDSTVGQFSTDNYSF